jgi:prepilin-type N-terminal cleavage/methylation domain-containing protein/prepilin-type processing-associated H-X9-DG protein
MKNELEIMHSGARIARTAHGGKRKEIKRKLSKKSMKPNRHNPAFSLMELLVVIAVVGILAALLLPVLSAAKSYTRSVPCKNNLYQMGLALKMYVTDNQDQYPRYLGPGGPSNGDASGKGGRAAGLIYWSSKLIPYYTRNWTNISMQCPGYNGKLSGPFNPGGIDRYGSYAYNAGGVNLDGLQESPGYPLGEFFGLGPVSYWKDKKRNAVPPVAENKVVVPSEMLAMGDSFMKVGMDGGSDVWQCDNLLGGELATAPYALRHGKNYNQLYCDGHVSPLSPAVLFNPSSTAALWNYDHQPHPELWTP